MQSESSMKKQGYKELKTFADLTNDVRNRLMQKIKNIWPLRRRDIIGRALMFCKANPDVLVIIADPKRDDIVCGYNNHYSAATIKHENMGGLITRRNNIIRSVINRTSKDDKEAEIKVNNFLQFIDGFLFNMSKEVNKTKVAENNNQTTKNMEDEQKETPEETPKTPAEKKPADEKAE